MPNTKDKIIKDVINGFQTHKGKMSFYCFDKDFIPKLIYNIIIPFHAKSPLHPIFIVVDGYETRVNILKYIEQQCSVDGVGLNIKIISKDFIRPQYHYSYRLSILVGVNEDFNIISHITKESTFTLCILTKNIMNNEFINFVRTILPSINIENTVNETNEARIYSPVEEYRIGVELTDKDKENYDKYTDYINTTVSILGNLSNIEKCKKGDDKLNISAAEFRTNLAKENGWNENLDTNIPFMKQIDDIYNPNIIFERACTFYTIAKNRRDLVTDNKSKLPIIANICRENKDKRILIISKRSEYAAIVSQYLRDNGIDCGDYHDCLEDKILIDEYGVPITVKSGVNKGKFRHAGWQLQSSINEKRFNNGQIKVLSIKNSSNTKLKIACDMVIFTSPFCDDIISIKARFSNVDFIGVPTKTYKIYCTGTIESNKLIKDKVNPIIKIYNDTKDSMSYDENSGDIII